MIIQQYSVNQYPIQTLLSWIESGEIAIPEIQRLMNCIPENIATMNYNEFLEERRKLMAQKIKKYFEML